MVQLALASLMGIITIVIHLAGLTGLLLWMRRAQGNSRFPVLRDGPAILGAAVGLFALHAIEIWSYALLYIIVEALPDIEAALFLYIDVHDGRIRRSRAQPAVAGSWSHL